MAAATEDVVGIIDGTFQRKTACAITMKHVEIHHDAYLKAVSCSGETDLETIADMAVKDMENPLTAVPAELQAANNPLAAKKLWSPAYETTSTPSSKSTQVLRGRTTSRRGVARALIF